MITVFGGSPSLAANWGPEKTVITVFGGQCVNWPKQVYLNMWFYLPGFGPRCVRQDVFAIFEAPSITFHLGYFDICSLNWGVHMAVLFCVMSLIVMSGKDCQCCILISNHLIWSLHSNWFEYFIIYSVLAIGHLSPWSCGGCRAYGRMFIKLQFHTHFVCKIILSYLRFCKYTFMLIHFVLTYYGMNKVLA